MGLLDFIKKAFNGESSLNRSPVESILGRGSGPVLDPKGVLKGVADSSGKSVKTRFGNDAPIVERALVDRVLAPSSLLGMQSGPSQLLPAGAQSAMAGMLGGLPTSNPVQTMPFNPPPMPGTPLDGPQGIQSGGMVMNPQLAPASYQPMQPPGGQGGLNMPMLLQALKSDPRAAEWLRRVWLSGQARGDVNAPGGPVGYAPNVNVEMRQE